MSQPQRQAKPGPKPTLRDPVTRTVVLERQAVRRAERQAKRLRVPAATALREIVMLGLTAMELQWTPDA